MSKCLKNHDASKIPGIITYWEMDFDKMEIKLIINGRTFRAFINSSMKAFFPLSEVSVGRLTPISFDLLRNKHPLGLFMILLYSHVLSVENDWKFFMQGIGVNLQSKPHHLLGVGAVA